MKKKILSLSFLLLLLVAVTCLLVGCGDGEGEDGPKMVTVTLDANGGAFADGASTMTVEVESGSLVTEPETPVWVGHEFLGWTLEDESWNFEEQTATAALTLTAQWSLNSYTVTLNENIEEGGTVTGGGEYDYGANVALTATPNSEYNFIGWYVGETPVSQSETYVFAMGSGDITVTAKWERKTYAVTVVSDDAYGTVTGAGSYISGASVTLTATPNQGYKFMGWYVNGTRVSVRSTYYLTMGSEAVTLEARWEEKVLLTYSLNSDGQSYTLVSIGEFDEAVLEIPALYNGLPVTIIGDEAAKGCTAITKVIIPDSVLTVNYRAFDSCTNLTDVVMGSGVTSLGNYSFSGCTKLVNLSIGSSVTTLGSGVFQNCTSLVTVVVPDSVTSIGSSVFKGCTGLASLTTPSLCDKINSPRYFNLGYLFGTTESTNNGDYVPASLKTVIITKQTKLYKGAFWGCRNLTEIVLPACMKEIVANTFNGCSKLVSLTVPFVGDKASGSNNTFLGYIFGASSAGNSYSYIPRTLRSVTVLGGTIGANAFYGCGNLTSLTLCDDVTYIYGDIYSGGLGALSDSVFTIYEGAKYIGNPDNPYRFLYQVSDTTLTSLTVHEDTVYVCDYAFYQCTSLGSVVIGDSVKTIGKHAFDGCTSLTGLTLGESIEELCEYAFAYTAITELALPDSMVKLHGGAFNDCANLTKVTLNDGLRYSDGGAFDGCTSLQFTVYDNAKYLGSESNPYLLLVKALNQSITSCLIHEDTVIIGGSAFYECGQLTSIVIPDSVVTIEDCAFWNCRKLREVTIGDGVTLISYYAFAGCDELDYAYVNTSGWYRVYPEELTYGSNTNLSGNPEGAADALRYYYYDEYFKRRV